MGEINVRGDKDGVTATDGEVVVRALCAQGVGRWGGIKFVTSAGTGYSHSHCHLSVHSGTLQNLK
jgi:formylmethanofuran dehydrogenase subunit D